MKIKDLVGYTPGQLIAESYYESKMLKEEESDYYRDYQNGLISYEEYKDLVRQFQGRSGHRHHSSNNSRPVMTGMYFYNVKPGEEDAADLMGVKKTKSGKWALVQYNTSGHTFNWNKQRADQRFGTGKFWSPKKESVSEVISETANPVSKKQDWKQSVLDKHPDATFKDPRDPRKIPKDGSYHIVAMVDGKVVDEIKGNLFTDKKRMSESNAVNSKKEAPKPRNFVAKNAINSGAGAHKDKKKAAKQGEVKHKKQLELAETATAGATSAANIGTVDNPSISPGKARGKKSYIGSPGHSGKKAPPQPMVVQPKKSDGTAVNGLDIKVLACLVGQRTQPK